MKTTLIIVFVTLVSILVLFIVLGQLSKSHNAPGLVNQKLSKCGKKPNCVNSEYTTDIKHYIAPIRILPNSTGDTLALLKKTIEEMGGTIQSENKNYIAATFTSNLFKFVDDLEIRIDTAQNLIHTRSESRVGYSDAGVNKQRLEILRKSFRDKTRK